MVGCGLVVWRCCVVCGGLLVDEIVQCFCVVVCVVVFGFCECFELVCDFVEIFVVCGFCYVWIYVGVFVCFVGDC